MPLFPAFYVVLCRTIAAAWMLAHRNRTVAQWYAEYNDTLTALAVRKFGHSRAVDFVGATWVGAVESFHRYDPSKGKPLTWLVWRLRGIAANYRDKHMAFDDERGRWREIAAPADDDLDPATVVDYDYVAQWAEAYRARTKGEVAILTTTDRASKDRRYRLRRKVRREARQDRPSPL